MCMLHRIGCRGVLDAGVWSWSCCAHIFNTWNALKACTIHNSCFVSQFLLHSFPLQTARLPASRVEAQREKEQMRRAWYTWIIYLCKCDDDDAYIPNEASGDGSRHRRTNERDSLYIFSCVCKYIIIIIGLYSMARLQHPDRFTHTLCVRCGLASGICTLL